VTAKINLLPPRYVERMAERRLARIAAIALVVLVVLLGLASLVQSRRLDQAERTRQVERARNDELVARRRALAPYRQLADGILGRERLLAGAMETQVSWAGVLTSLSQTFPAGASLTSLVAESTLPAFGAVPPVKGATEARVIGSTTLHGYSVERFTPGVERMLQLLDGVVGLSQPRLQIGTVQDLAGRSVTTFEGETFLDGAALTSRYANGLPPENDVELPRLGGAAPAASSPSATSERASR
jgi:Tfp pilus assembly protein PilN